ncbi:hypothetical protein NMY22_g9948 [Coprinellus aureogranulatus]|nr:hypothetical protein NMY22_g9948 [Coprinellus aureogranulatus]
MASSDVSTTTATLHYYVPPDNGVRAYQYTHVDPISGVRKHNIKKEPHDVVIENVRGKEDQYTLDNAGFQFLKAPPKHRSFENDEAIQNEYYPESIELIKQVTGASRVVIFDHRITFPQLSQA